jgi:hypothetical protein
VGLLGWTENSGVGSWGVYSHGRLGASGVKAFVIDHPFDPANKYLNHYCTEGPEPLNVYSGNVTTDSKGSAWVQLPDYFEEINKDFRYQLTIVDLDNFAMVRVAHEIKDSAFEIRTSQAHIKVSWRVEGVRNDRWMREYGAPSEVDKPEHLRGTYVSPELYGQPRDMAEYYRPPGVRKPVGRKPGVAKQR